MDYSILLSLAIILLSTKVLSLVTRKVHMPAVVGALMAGVILGPSGIDILKGSDFITQTSQIGVIILMFLAGLDTDLDELKSTLKASIVIALLGVIVPLSGGFIAHNIFFDGTSQKGMLEAVFTGIVLTATSVSITVETLREMGKLKGKMGAAILGAAIIDDIVGIVMLTLITSFNDKSINPTTVVIKILAFFILLIIVFFVTKYTFSKIFHKPDEKRRVAIYGFAFCFVMAYVAEHYFGVADITGAFFAGLILCNIGVNNYIAKKVNVVSYMLFAPIFFASIGLKTDLSGFTTEIFIFAMVLLIIAILSKSVGCTIGALICKFNKKDSLIIGMGMVSRGEVALIMTQKGFAAGLLKPELFPAIIIVVVVTTLITPILIKLAVGRESGNVEKNVIFN